MFLTNNQAFLIKPLFFYRFHGYFSTFPAFSSIPNDWISRIGIPNSLKADVSWCLLHLCPPLQVRRCPSAVVLVYMWKILPTKQAPKGWAHSMSDSFNPMSSKDEELLDKLLVSCNMVAACVLELRRRKFDLSKTENFSMAFRLVKALHNRSTDKKLIEYVGNLKNLLQLPEADLPATFSLTYRRRSGRNCTASKGNSDDAAALNTNKVSYRYLFMSIFLIIFVSILTKFCCRNWKKAQQRLSIAAAVMVQ